MIKNILQIYIYQIFFEKLKLFVNSILILFLKKNYNEPVLIEDIDFFCKGVNCLKHALIVLDPKAWLQAQIEYPHIKKFNYVGLTYEMVKALNENYYKVDISDVNTKYKPIKNYDLLIGHGGNCKLILDNIGAETQIIQYASGAYWESFNHESQERYDSFINRKKVNEKINFKRSLDNLIEGEELLTQKAHKILMINFPRVAKSFGKYGEKFSFVGYATYPDKLLDMPIKEKDFDNGRQNFIYVGGTNGNIQKGMDLLIEAFSKTPELNLYIYCKVEEEILRYYKNELNNKNIRYIYHWRFKPFQKKLKKLMEKVVFTVHAPINTGLGTAFMGSMLIGLIPVGYVDLEEGLDFPILTDNVD